MNHTLPRILQFFAVHRSSYFSLRVSIVHISQKKRIDPENLHLLFSAPSLWFPHSQANMIYTNYAVGEHHGKHLKNRMRLGKGSPFDDLENWFGQAKPRTADLHEPQ